MNSFTFWTDCGGAIVFLFRFLVANNHISTNAVTLLNKCAASAARASVTSRSRNAFDPGYWQTDAYGIRHYKDRRDRLTHFQPIRSHLHYSVYTFDAKYIYGKRTNCEIWAMHKEQVKCWFYDNRVTLVVQKHPLAQERPSDQHSIDLFNAQLTLPDDIVNVFGSGSGQEEAVCDEQYGIFVSAKIVQISFGHRCLQMPTVRQKRFLWQHAVACLSRLRADGALEYDGLYEMPHLIESMQ